MFSVQICILNGAVDSAVFTCFNLSKKIVVYRRIDFFGISLLMNAYVCELVNYVYTNIYYEQVYLILGGRISPQEVPYPFKAGNQATRRINLTEILKYIFFRSGQDGTM